MPVNEIVGDDGANVLTGGAGADLIYGFDPDGPQADVSAIAATRVAAGLNQPLYAAAAPGDFAHLYIVEKGGLIRVLDLTTNTVAATPFLDLTQEVSTDGERGLLGFAFDPDYAENGYVYVYLTNDTTGDSEVRRYTVVDGVADPDTEHAIITIDQPNFDNHKGGWIAFGEDGLLYIATGDGGSGGDPNNNAQNPNALLGKMLRIDVHGDDFTADASRNYAIPDDNPFVGVVGADEIYALGLRNPWRNSFDLATGQLYIADVGQSNAEEVNLGVSGANYGWRRYEGNGEFNTDTDISIGTLTFPVHTYDQNPSASITGGYVYRGEADGLQGQYIFADFSSGRVFSLHHDGANWVVTERTAQIEENIGTLTNPASFAQDAAGNLYIISIGGSIYRLTPVTESADVGDTLSGLGGDDFLYGGAGADAIDGGADNDHLVGADGHDHLTGGAGADTLLGGAGFDYARYDAAGAGVAADLVNGGTAGDAAGDVYSGIEGLVGSGFDDTLAGTDGVNDMHGQGGADWMEGRGGDDALIGGDGHDHLSGGAGADILDGGAGFDYARYDAAASGLSADLAGTFGATGEGLGDVFVSIEGLVGSAFDDTLRGDDNVNDIHGGAGADALHGRGHDDYLGGGEGHDHLYGGAGADILDGGAGFDYARYDDAAAGVAADLVGTFGTGGEALGDVFVSIEGMVGSAFADTLRGDNAANDMHGQGGDDTLEGRGGADVLSGGAGADTFVFQAGQTHGDTILDFDGAGAGVGDAIVFNGYGTAAQGASFTQLDATHWQIASADGLIVEVIVVVNGASIDASDYIFGGG